MNCLTESEISQWLRQRQTTEAPYQSPQGSSSRYHLQFESPKNHLGIDSFFRQYLEQIVGASETLTHITDWGLYTPSEMIAIMGIRALNSEMRYLIDSPGHLLVPRNGETETETVIALMSLTTHFSWCAYLYCPANRATLYTWEGEIMDFWTDRETQFKTMEKLTNDLALAATSQSK
ncbi:hypothetical protein SAMN02745166_01441 [Prosthecobacter debontii]|uniref:Uncharacterized protein n=1 Tax=Prosthecobacter debontii TaxID=48467 RepID=A0A1T4XG75_9BACT|nr:hypothetical protein [Prosthecobacter debontii]SKA88546.1 hypothetical protein SAMN02745166_01441 [Prosthecobacter debontii]